MCGHVGIAGKLAHKDEATMKRLYMLDYFRGPDSTGFVGVRGNGEVKLAKVASHPLDLFDMGRFKDGLSGHNSTVFLGHNRAATKGKISTTNAHPFVFDHIAGAHNGTLSVLSHGRLEDKLGEKYDVDSMALFASIAKFGIDETIAILRESDAGVSCPDAWALVWFDSNEGTLNFLRNKERPMWYSYTKEFDKVVWASEWPMIEAAVSMAPSGAYSLFQTEEGYRFFSMDEDIHYKFVIDDLKKGSDARPKPMAKKIIGKGTAPVYTSKATYDPFQRNGQKSHGSTTNYLNGGASQPKEDPTEDTNLLHLFAERTDPYGGIISKERFEELAAYGCSWCQTDVAYEDVGCTIISRDDILLCPHCSASPKGTNRVYVKDLTAVGG